jgi:hypothetical protein
MIIGSLIDLQCDYYKHLVHIISFNAQKSKEKILNNIGTNTFLKFIDLI